MSAFTLTAHIIAKRAEALDDGKEAMMYYLNDGVYGSFNCTIFDHWQVYPSPLLAKEDFVIREKYLSTLWGPTCDSMDCIKRDVGLPEMHIGEWIVFREMGAYTIAAATTFNGFKYPDVKFLVDADLIRFLESLANWERIAAILCLDDS